MERFDQRDPEAPFIEITKLKQSGNLETYIYEFLKLSVMVPNLSVARRVYMPIDGLVEPLHEFINSTKSTTLQDAIERDRDIQYALPRAKETFQQKPFFPSKGKDEKAHPSKESQNKVPLSDDI